MRLAKVYRNQWDETPLIRDMLHMRFNCGRLELETLLGEERVIMSKEVEVDFITCRITLGEHRETEE